jgi:hypothetical protein
LGAPRFLIHDRDAKYGTEIPAAIRSDHVIALNERHLKRLLSDYVSYHHEDRTHVGLGKRMPGCRTHCITSGRVLSHDRLGGLHHRYDRAA